MTHERYHKTADISKQICWNSSSTLSLLASRLTYQSLWRCSKLSQANDDDHGREKYDAWKMMTKQQTYPNIYARIQAPLSVCQFID
jgi:hypothetical protein